MLNIALLQMVSAGTDQAANLLKGEAYCRRAKESGADIALFPEMWNIGYTSFWPFLTTESTIWKAPERWNGNRAGEPEGLAEARATWQARAIGPDDPFVVHFRDLARELEMAIGLTYLERWPGAPRNTFALIDRHGEIVLTYAKVHTCDFDLFESALTPGDGFEVCTLDTEHGAVQIGAMICYDREFPESARILMVKGAEVILTPNACWLEWNRLTQFRVRAFENLVGLAMANYAAPQENGHSCAFDPIVFDARGATRDTLIVEAGGAEGAYMAKFDLEHIRDFRRRETWGNAFRRPHRYGALTSTKITAPFVRTSATGGAYDPSRR
ncbi:MAG: carbon-nitrogen hydrolase family protein [Thermomicrobiales bacterium]